MWMDVQMVVLLSMKYYSAIKSNEELMHIVVYRKLKIIILCDKSDNKIIHIVWFHLCNILKKCKQFCSARKQSKDGVRVKWRGIKILQLLWSKGYLLSGWTLHFSRGMWQNLNAIKRPRKVINIKSWYLYVNISSWGKCCKWSGCFLLTRKVHGNWGFVFLALTVPTQIFPLHYSVSYFFHINAFTLI